MRTYIHAYIHEHAYRRTFIYSCVHSTYIQTDRHHKFVHIYIHIDTYMYFHRSGILFGILEGLAYGISQGRIYFGYVIAFRFGAFLVPLDEGHILHVEFQDVFRVLFALVFGALAVEQASTFAPNYTKAKLSTYRIFSLLDRKPIIDNYSTDGKELVRL